MVDHSGARPTWLTRLTSLTSESLLVFASLFAAFLTFRELALITIFQERDLERARQVARGEWFFYGPEVTGGGHLPGAFYYYLNAIPMKLGLDWEGCWQLTLLLGAAGFALMWWGLRRSLSLEAALAGGIALLCLPQFYKTLVYFQNFSLLPLFLVIALLGLGMAFAFNPQRARLGWILFGAATGICLQLHMSTYFLIAAGVSLQVFGPWLGLRRLPWKDFAYGAAALGVLVAPYYIWLFAYNNGVDLGQVPPRYVGVDFSVENFHQSTMLSFDSRGLRALSKRLVLGKFLDEMSLLISLPLLAMSVWLYNHRRSREAGPLSQAEAAFRVWLVCTAFTVLPALTIIMTPHRSRYFTFLVFSGVFAFAAGFEVVRRRLSRPIGPTVYLSAFVVVAASAFFRLATLKWQRPDEIPWNWLMAAPAAAAAFYWLWSNGRQRLGALLALLFLGGFSYNARFYDTFARDNGPRLAVLEAASAEIAGRTGWSWTQVRERLYQVNFHYQRSMATIYRHALAEVEGRTPTENPDGYILALDYRSRKRGPATFRRWLLESGIPPLIRDGLRDEKIELGEMLPMPDDAILVPYTVKDKLKYPPRFQNVGINYLEFSSDEKRVIPASDGFGESLSSTHTRFTLNDCPDRDSFCTVNFDVREEDREIEIQITGDVLSQPSVYISPNWSQTLYEPFLRVQCANGRTVRAQLLDGIGVIVDMLKVRNLNMILLAPAVRRIANPCPGNIRFLAAGYASSKMTQTRQRFKELPGREVSLKK